MSTESTPIISRVLPDGTLIETVYDPEQSTTALAVGSPEGATTFAPHYDLPDGSRLVPYSPTNNLLTTGCVLLPSALGEVGDKGDVLREIQQFLARYVDLSPAFAEIVPYYVLLTWVYDAFNELPYLRFQGDYGTGKTRALITVGSLSYKPFFASGASTVSPIFHILDAFRGTLVLDEADFRFSDATGELTKVLNNGSVNGLPVLRTMTNRHRELNPQAFRVFGPKILAMREGFQDRALESRFITEETSRRPLPPHIPIHTPESLGKEACELRNRLLAWRMRYRHTISPDATVRIAGGSARLNQTALALLSLVEDEEARARIARYLLAEHEREHRTRTDRPEVHALAAIAEALAEATGPIVRIADVTERFNRHALERLHHPLTYKAIGVLVREKLGIPTTKSHGVYGIGQEERERICELADRFGVPHTLPMPTTSSPEGAAGSAEVHASIRGA
jgi:hypothetical protein